MKSLLGLDLHSNDIGRYQLDPDTFINLANLSYLDISVNTISDLPYDIFSSLTNLTQLLINNNSLTTIKFRLQQLSRLNVLDLSYNQITTIPETTRSELNHLFAQDPTLTIYLKGNTLLHELVCDCENRYFMNWLLGANHHIPGLEPLNCTYLNGTVMPMSRLPEIIKALTMNCTTLQVVLGCVGTFFGLLLLSSLVAVLHQYRWKFQYLYYIGRRNVNPYRPLESVPDELHTDIYISFNEEENGRFYDYDSLYDFVTQKLYKELQGLGLSVKIRNAVTAGRRLNETLAEAITHSKNVVVLLTPGFGEDFWNIFEFHEAALQGIFLGKNKMIIVKVAELKSSDIHPAIKKYVYDDDVIHYNEHMSFADFINEIGRKML